MSSSLKECRIKKGVDTIACNNGTAIPWKKSISKQFTVIVEGNIGSGKSTLLNYFKDCSEVEVLYEPVHLWKDVKGFNTLDLIYKDPRRWGLTFQSYVQLTMLKNHTKKTNRGVKMLERSIYSSRYCFVENLFKSDLMPDVDYAVLNEWFEWMTSNSQIDVDLIGPLFIVDANYSSVENDDSRSCAQTPEFMYSRQMYLRASPEACLERIKERNRFEETDVPIEYLESLHELHEDWLIRQTKFKLPAPVLILDASQSLVNLRIDVEKRREEILCGYV